MITIKEVSTRKQRKDFINFPLKLYKNNPYFVPCLYSDEKKIFSDKNMYSESSESKFFLAYKDNKVVGRISVILQKSANKKRKEKAVRFTRFDSIDDQEVANALFDAATEYSKSIGMNIIRGPLGYSDLEREGLLIEGFEELSTFEEQYNYPYYQKLIENYGFTKDIDWTERKIYIPKEKDPNIEKVLPKIIKRYGFKIKEFKNTKQIIKEHKDSFFSMLDEAYKDLYQTVPFSEKEKNEIIKLFKILLSPKYIRICVDKNNELVAFGLTFPSISKALQKSNGKLTLPCLFKILKSVKSPEIIDLGLVGVVDKYRSSGAAWVIFNELFSMSNSFNVKHFETNLNLETNNEIQNTWNKFDSVMHKRRRSYIKHI